MEDIIGKIQELNNLFQHSVEDMVSLQQFCDRLSHMLRANIYIFFQNGEILCYSLCAKYDCCYSDISLRDRMLPQKYKSIFDGVERSVFNVYEKTPTCTCKDVDKCIYSERFFSIVPIYYYAMNVTKAGMLMMRYGSSFEQEEEILCEYTAMLVSLELFYQNKNSIKEEAMQIAGSQIAVKYLSIGELNAAKVILEQIDNDEGSLLLVKVADQAFVTQSVVSNALKKLESAGVISTRSCGVKGKYVKVNNKYVLDDIKIRMKKR